jgi:hypothetical protein
LREVDADPIRALAEGLRGSLDKIPLAVSRDLANEAEQHRRWYGRKGKHARGPARLEVGIDPDAGPSPGSDTPDEILARRDLSHRVHAKLRAADEREVRKAVLRALSHTEGVP